MGRKRSPPSLFDVDTDRKGEPKAKSGKGLGCLCVYPGCTANVMSTQAFIPHFKSKHLEKGDLYNPESRAQYERALDDPQLLADPAQMQRLVMSRLVKIEDSVAKKQNNADPLEEQMQSLRSDIKGYMERLYSAMTARFQEELRTAVDEIRGELAEEERPRKRIRIQDGEDDVITPRAARAARVEELRNTQEAPSADTESTTTKPKRIPPASAARTRRLQGASTKLAVARNDLALFLRKDLSDPEVAKSAKEAEARVRVMEIGVSADKALKAAKSAAEDAAKELKQAKNLERKAQGDAKKEEEAIAAMAMCQESSVYATRMHDAADEFASAADAAMQAWIGDNPDDELLAKAVSARDAWEMVTNK